MEIVVSLDVTLFGLPLCLGILLSYMHEISYLHIFFGFGLFDYIAVATFLK